jgi:hypothetical protein
MRKVQRLTFKQGVGSRESKRETSLGRR